MNIVIKEESIDDLNNSTIKFVSFKAFEDVKIKEEESFSETEETKSQHVEIVTRKIKFSQNSNEPPLKRQKLSDNNFNLQLHHDSKETNFDDLDDDLEQFDAVDDTIQVKEETIWDFNEEKPKHQQVMTKFRWKNPEIPQNTPKLTFALNNVKYKVVMKPPKISSSNFEGSNIVLRPSSAQLTSKNSLITPKSIAKSQQLESRQSPKIMTLQTSRKKIEDYFQHKPQESDFKNEKSGQGLKIVSVRSQAADISIKNNLQFIHKINGSGINQETSKLSSSSYLNSSQINIKKTNFVPKNASSENETFLFNYSTIKCTPVNFSRDNPTNLSRLLQADAKNGQIATKTTYELPPNLIIKQVLSNDSQKAPNQSQSSSSDDSYESNDSNDSFYFYKQFLLHAGEISNRYKSCLSSSSSESSDDEFSDSENSSNSLKLKKLSALETLKRFKISYDKSQNEVTSHEVVENVKKIKEKPEENIAVTVREEKKNECSVKIEKLKLQDGSTLKYGEKYFVCFECNAVFMSTEDFLSHYNFHHSKSDVKFYNKSVQKIFHKCLFCTEKFEKRADLDGHLTTHKTLVKLECSECKREVSINPQFILKSKCHEIVFRCYLCIDKIKSKQKELENQVGIRNIKKIENMNLVSVNPNTVGINRSLENLRKNPITKIANNFKLPVIDNSRKIIKINSKINVGQNLSFKNAYTIERSTNGNSQKIKTVDTNTKKFKCNVCGFELISKIKFFWHMKGHSEGRIFKCPVCRQEFDSREAMIDHCKDYHSPNSSRNNKYAIKNHETTQKLADFHDKKSKIKCNVCNILLHPSEIRVSQIPGE